MQLSSVATTSVAFRWNTFATERTIVGTRVTKRIATKIAPWVSLLKTFWDETFDTAISLGEGFNDCFHFDAMWYDIMTLIFWGIVQKRALIQEDSEFVIAAKL